MNTLAKAVMAPFALPVPLPLFPPFELRWAGRIPLGAAVPVPSTTSVGVGPPVNVFKKTCLWGDI